MPQLDHAIVFTQIFWLFFTFSFLYISLTHFFLPRFLQSLKARNLILTHNETENNEIGLVFISNQVLLNTTMNEQLSIIKSVLSHSIILINVKSAPNLYLMNNLLLDFIFYTTLYCDTMLLNKIPLNSKTHGCMRKN
uniref:ATP synthase F0 subunit 8 n=1 Tax=Sirodotia delicatula TaxID=386631 RepID=A0A343UY47_9FLOR|nr:ATP synthase F0 subunit 8 [Sirodotia delicatula]AVK39604.1 ATP synthase F0 subunit 8 [Sirodotia delicatula]